jgi:glycosyltransferase involved in cell wall biosynthesis
MSELHVVVLQFGDFAEGYERLAAGGPQTYYAQRHSIECMVAIAGQVRRLTIGTIASDQCDTVLDCGIHTFGLRLYPAGGGARDAELIARIDALKPDRLIIASPVTKVLRWARDRRIPTLPTFYDSFRASGWRQHLKHWLLARVLRSDHFVLVGNHGVSAARDLVRIGVPATKVVPMDWPAFDTPAARPAKDLPSRAEFKLIYVGQIRTDKGVGDLIDAVAALNAAHADRRYSLTIVGQGDLGALGHAVPPDAVRLLGPISHERVVPLMNEHDAVAVPSHHAYPEGIPMTIYEALCSRSPLIASDHPMFAHRVHDGDNGVVFEAASVPALASAIRRLSTDAALYRGLSERCEQAAAHHLCPLKNDELWSRWLQGTPDDLRYLSGFSLANHAY